MHLIALAWIYVALMMALAEAFSPSGRLLGALFTFVLYGLLPLGVVLYIGDAPRRRRQRLQAEQAEQAMRAAQAPNATLTQAEPAPVPAHAEPATSSDPSVQPDAGRKAPAAPVPPV